MASGLKPEGTWSFWVLAVLTSPFLTSWFASLADGNNQVVLSMLKVPSCGVMFWSLMSERRQKALTGLATIVSKGIATRSKKLLVAPGITTRNKKLLVTTELDFFRKEQGTGHHAGGMGATSASVNPHSHCNPCIYWASARGCFKENCAWAERPNPFSNHELPRYRESAR